MHKTLVKIAAAAAILLPGMASSHVMLLEPSATAGSSYVAAYIMHERCGQSVSTGLRLIFPDTIVAADPRPKPGWKLSVKEEGLPQPVIRHDRTIARRLREVVWEIEVPRPSYDETFEVTLHLPPTPGVVYLPAYQSCLSGERHWIEVPTTGQSAQDLRRPAPELRIEPVTPPNSAR